MGGRKRKYCFAKFRCLGEIPGWNFADVSERIKEIALGSGEEGLNKTEMKQEGTNLGIASSLASLRAAKQASFSLLFKKKQ